MGKTRILLVDDHQVVLGGIKSALEEYPEFSVVAEARDGREGVKKVLQHKPDIVIMDLSLPDLNGVDATMQIKRAVPNTRVIIFTMYSDREYVISLLKAGISGYVLKEDSISDLVLAVQAVRRGGTYFSTTAPKVWQECGKFLERPGRALDGFDSLTLREREVLQLFAEGCSVKDVASKLHLSPKTVETHKYHIMEKLGACSVVELARIAIRKKLIQA
ncbi:MAG: response regulator transcription factor [Deltaproteobacteria bacterium]|nr:response regulator transcription factor [Deltaproteobacteria bacterium]